MLYYSALFGHHSIFICVRSLCLVCFSSSCPRFQGGDSQQCPPGRGSVQLCLSGGSFLHIPAATQARSESDYRDYSQTSVTVILSKIFKERLLLDHHIS